jgi:Protein of unknown function (DUF2690)
MSKNRFILLLVLLVISLGLFLQERAYAAPSQHAQSHVTCQGDGCDGLDPLATGCNNGAYTARTTVIQNEQGNNIGEVDLRFSPTCGTNWARVISYIGSTTLTPIIERNDGLAYCWPNIPPQDGVTSDCTLHHSTTGVRAWTFMVYSPQPNTAFAIGSVADEERATDWG